MLEKLEDFLAFGVLSRDSEVMPLIAASSPKEVGTRSRSSGTMVRWRPYTMGISAKSSERR